MPPLNWNAAQCLNEDGFSNLTIAYEAEPLLKDKSLGALPSGDKMKYGRHLAGLRRMASPLSNSRKRYFLLKVYQKKLVYRPAIPRRLSKQNG
ncbi:hypothetical protein [Pseudomonas gozinkensis]|uniref:hypothetical protein n=1 Tax=Pseudomonas gozinkensis TaxID=2774461 RepID=UPI0017888D0C|nr:hypothetical protein [Pseudomonas gozinkensis]